MPLKFSDARTKNNFEEHDASEENRLRMMKKRSAFQQNFSWMLSGIVVVMAACVGLLAVALGIVILGHVLSYLSTSLLKGETLAMFHYVLIMLVVTCIAGLGIPIAMLARNIQRSAESFSLLQFDEEADEDEDYDEDIDFDEESEELNEFLKKLHKTRNIGPFIPSPKTMNDFCPCGSGLKYKDCCGKAWI
jgi:ABC-type multidrug transport system fused ATPase/permease subunit